MKKTVIIALLLNFTGLLWGEEWKLNFSQGLPGWQVNLGKENIQIVQTPFGQGITMLDSSRKEACNIETDYLPVKQGGYKLTGKIKVQADEGITIKVRFYNAQHKELDMSEIVWIRTPADGPWTDFSLDAYAAWPDIHFCKVFIYSWYETMPTFSVAQLVLRRVAVNPIPPRWQPTYRDRKTITPDEMLGPDGIVYPDFTHAGLKTPNAYSHKVTLEAFGGKAQPGFDNYPAMDTAMKHLAQHGGGELLLGSGTYELAHPIYVHHDNIAIRGTGPDKTKILFRFSPGPDGIRFCWLKDDQRVGEETSLIAVAQAKDMIGMNWYVDGKNVCKWRKNASEGNYSSHFIRLSKDTKPGKHLIRAEAIYASGKPKSVQTTVTFVPGLKTLDIPEKLEAAFLFAGQGFVPERIHLAKFEPKQGQHILELKYTPTYQPGDLIKIEAPLTDRWRNLVQSTCRWGYFRDYLAEVKWQNGRRIGLTQPLRMDFPLVDKPFVQKLKAIRNCELSGLQFQQTENIWLATVFFKYASNCKTSDLKIIRAGRHPFFSYWSRNLEVTNCEFDDIWDRGGGGAGYTSWELTFDSLMDKVTTNKMRHAPSFQWAAAGNVIRRSNFKLSDAHWHAGWTNNNLIEKCTIQSEKGYGSYGYGMWASFPGDGGKGPNGPRNVVYNCDVSSPLGSVWLGGMNENWIICYNRFHTRKGPGVLLQNQAMETIIHGNVFKIDNPNTPMVMFKTPDCTGVEITDNILLGGSGIHNGLIAPEINTGNSKKPMDLTIEDVALEIKVPSIYEWQLKKKGIRR